MTTPFTINNVDITSKKIDARRNRKYGREFALTFEIGTTSKYDCDWGARKDWSKVAREAIESLYHHQFRYIYSTVTKDDGVIWVQLQGYVRAEKPSFILPEKHILGLLPMDYLKKQAIEALTAEHNRCVERDQVHEDAENATKLRDHLSETARERALEITRFKQRLAGLVAEFKAEAKVQFDKVVNELDINMLLNEGISQRAIEVGINSGRNYSERSPIGRPFSSSTSVTRKEVAAHSVESE